MGTYSIPVSVATFKGCYLIILSLKSCLGTPVRYSLCVVNTISGAISQYWPTFNVAPSMCTECCFALFCYGLIMRSWWIYNICLPIAFRVTSLALGQSYDCPSASEVTLMDLEKSTNTKPQQNRNKHKPCAYSLFMYWGFSHHIPLLSKHDPVE